MSYIGIFLIDLLTCGAQSTRIAIVGNAPLFRLFDEESNITDEESIKAQMNVIIINVMLLINQCRYFKSVSPLK